MGPLALLPLRRKACWGFFALKNPKASAGLTPNVTPQYIFAASMFLAINIHYFPVQH
jgi:hypothetical protein